MVHESWETKVVHIKAAVIGKYVIEAARMCTTVGWISRVCIADGIGRLGQLNFRPDRNDQVVDSGVVTATRTG